MFYYFIIILFIYFYYLLLLTGARHQIVIHIDIGTGGGGHTDPLSSFRVSDVRQQVAYEARQASRRGVSGVPFFEFNGEPAFSGAQEVATFEAYLKEYAGN